MSSTVNVRRISTTRNAVYYELYGTRGSEKHNNNLAEGTTRVAALRTDAGSVDEYVDRAEALAEQHGRKIETRSIIQSFPNEQMDPNDPASVQYVNDLGYELAKKLHPNSDVLVITHVDGVGGHPHNHIKVLNHDNVTGKALRGNHLHWQVALVNDELMVEHSLGVVERSSHKDRAKYWEAIRDSGKLSEFDQKLGDDIAESLADIRSVDQESFSKMLAGRGIELEEKVHPIHASADGKTPADESVGWTYKAMDETGEKPRKRRRKASGLSDEFTHKGAQEVFDYNKERQAQNVSNGQSKAAATTARRININAELAAAASARVELGDIQRLDLDGPSAGGDVADGRGAGVRPERDREAAEGDVDHSGARDKLLAAAERRTEEQQRDQQDRGPDSGAAVEQRSSEADGREQRKPVRSRFVRPNKDNERESGGYGLGD